MDPRLIMAAISNRRVRLIILGTAAAAVALAAAGLLAAMSMLSSVMSGSAALYSELSSTSSYCVPPAATQAAYSSWSAEQVTNAATIIRVGQSRQVPRYGQIIAVATSMQEAHLINVDYGTSDSLGLFQQRPSQGWGTPAQVMDPVYSAGQFYLHLEAVPGWQQLPLTEAAQAVQVSKFPDAYAKWATAAASLVAHITGGSPVTLTAATVSAGSCGPGSVPAGTPARVRAVLAYARSALGTLYDYGGSCTDPHSADMALHCDCSSLVQQSFERGAGFAYFPRTAAEQWQWGKAGHAVTVPLAQAQVGDVVYFPSYLGRSTIGHTGIITDPKIMTMIEAPQTGELVKYGSYDPAGLPYGTHLFTILRFITVRSGA